MTEQWSAITDFEKEERSASRIEFDPFGREWVICDDGTMRTVGEWSDDDHL